MKIFQHLVLSLCIAAAAAAAIAPRMAKAQQQELAPAQDVLTTASSDHSLGIFAGALRSSGIPAKMDEKGPWTIFALNNQSFANVGKDDLQALLANPAAMHFLLTHYVVHSAVTRDELGESPDLRTIAAARLRIDVRTAAIYINTALLPEESIHCTNGTIFILQGIDPQFLHEALGIAKPVAHQESKP